MIDRVLAIVCMAALIAFTSVLVIYIRELDLMIVIVICLAVGIYDFWTNLRQQNEGGNDAR